MEKNILAIGLVLLISATVFACGCVDENAPASPTTVLDEATTVYSDEYMSYSARLDKGDTITISVTTDGSPIDLFLMNAQDFDEYKNTQSRHVTYYVAGSALNVVSKTYTLTVPESNTYYIVADNTETPEGGAYAGYDVNVRMVITG